MYERTDNPHLTITNGLPGNPLPLINLYKFTLMCIIKSSYSQAHASVSHYEKAKFSIVLFNLNNGVLKRYNCRRAAEVL